MRKKRTIYDRKDRRARDFSIGNRRVYLELEIRRVSVFTGETPPCRKSWFKGTRY